MEAPGFEHNLAFFLLHCSIASCAVKLAHYAGPLRTLTVEFCHLSAALPAQPCPALLTSCLSAGYYGEGLNAIIVFAACFLPDSSSPDYHYIMENLFL